MWVRFLSIPQKIHKMLHYNNEKWSGSLDTLLISEGIFAEDEDKLVIEVLLNKGIYVYTYYDPYLMEMYQKGRDAHQYHLIWHTDKDILDYQYDQSARDV